MQDADDELTEFSNQIVERSPDSWDGDEAQEAIAIRYVRHLEDEVRRLGGCLHPWCHWEDGEPCDHGYIAEPIVPRR
jgi:hypothetical protein